MAGVEGWDWVRVQTDPCPQCGHDPAHIPDNELGAAGTDEAAAWRDFLAAAPTEQLRDEPAPGVWSPMECAAHVRDMFRVFGDRILLAVEHDNPSVRSFSPTDAEFAAYNDLDPANIATDIRVQADRLASILRERGPGDRDRTAMRDGVDRFTVGGLARFAVHEAHHHLLDANGQLPLP
jgi:hypothetical protein